MHAVLLILSALISAAPMSAVPTGVNLADLDGWDIVVAPDAIASERYAAEELRDHLVRAGGPKLPIVQAAQGTARHVFIGPGAAMRKSSVGFDVEDLGSDDLRIVMRDELIAIAGGRPRGTLYGVYTFLEDYLGVRFVTEDFTHVPVVGPYRMVGPVDRIHRPSFEWRWTDFEANYARPEFAARRRLNGDSRSTGRTNKVKALPPGSRDWSLVGRYGGRSATILPGHTLQYLISPYEHAEEHPEYYQMWKGEMWAKKKYSDGKYMEGLQPCLSHPDVRRIVTRKTLSKLAESPDLKNVCVGQNDSSKYCDCDRCAAIDERAGSAAGSVLEIVNLVADAVAEEYPDRLVATFAYDYSQEPPMHLRPRPNVEIWYCQSQCFIHALDDPTCERNVVQYRRMRGWSKLTDNLMVWTYYMNHDRRGFQLPQPNLQWIDRDLRTHLAMGVKGLFTQATSSSNGNEFGGLRNYVLSRMMWDASQNAQQLMDEWVDLYYGPAAPPIRRWLRRLHDRALASGLHRHCVGGRYDEYGLDETDVQFGFDAIDEGMKLADRDEIRDRVEKASIWAYRSALEPVWYVTADNHVEKEVAEKVRPYAIRFFELCEKHGVKRTASGGYFTMEESLKRVQNHLGKW